MVPAGGPTEATVQTARTAPPNRRRYHRWRKFLFQRRCARARRNCKEKGIHYVDVGTSGGVWGLERGYCMMIGGPKEAVQRLDPIFKTLAPGKGDIPRTPGREKLGGTAEDGYIHCGPSGSGHFVKMVHNGIEYGIMQAYAEGFDIFKNATSKELPEDLRYDLNLPDIAEVWRRGSVVSSWLLDLTAMALTENPTLSEYTGFVQDSGEGRWTIQAAIDEAVPADVLTAALYVRFRSRQEHTFAEKMLSAMRQKFGGHVEPAEKEVDRSLVMGRSGIANDKRRRLTASQTQFVETRESARTTRISMAQLAEQPKAAPPAPRIGKQGDPCVMVIFGAPGDLTGRMLIPALYNLARAGLLSREFAVLGVARARYSDEDFRKKVYEDIKTYCGDCVDNDLWEWFAQRFYYLQGNFDDDKLYVRLKEALTKLDQEHSTHQNFFYYLAIAPNFFGPIVEKLAADWPDGPELTVTGDASSSRSLSDTIWNRPRR